MPEKKKYVIQIPGQEHIAYWNEDKYNANRDKLFQKYPDAQVTEFSQADINSIDDSGQYTISIPGQEHIAQWDGAKLSANRDKLFQKYPNAQIRKMNDVTANRNRDFARQYEYAQDKVEDTSLTDGERLQYVDFVNQHADRYGKLKEQYGRTATGGISEEDMPEDETIHNIFQYAWQSTKQMVGGHILKAIGETAKSTLHNIFGPSVKDSQLAAEALAEIDRRIAAGEDPYANHFAELMKGYGSLTGDEKRKRDKMADIEMMIAARSRGNHNVEELRALLAEEAGQKTDLEKVGATADTIISENSKQPSNNWVALGGLAPMLATTGISVGMTAATKNPKYAEAFGKATFAAFAASSAGAAMDEARKAGANDDQTMTAGLVSAAIMYGIGKIPFNQITSKAAATAQTSAMRSAMSALENPQVRAAAEKEMQKLLKQAADAAGVSFEHYAKNVLTQVGESVASFATMGGLEAIVPLIYEDPEEYPVLNNIAQGVIGGVRDGVVMGVVFGGATSGQEYIARRKDFKKHGGAAAAVVDLGKSSEGVFEWDGKAKTWKPVKLNEVPDGNVSWAELISREMGAEKGPADWVHIRIGNTVYRVKPDAIDPSTVVLFKANKGVDEEQRARDAFTDAGREEGQNASSTDEQNRLRIEDSYIRKKAENEAASNGSLSDATSLDVARADAVMQGRRDAIRNELDSRIGRPYWRKTTLVTPAEEGNAAVPEQEIDIVDLVTYKDGREVYIIGEKDGTLVTLDVDGKPGFISQKDLQNAIEVGNADRRQLELDDYLDSKVREQDAIAEKERMAKEKADNLIVVRQRIMQDGRINVGTPESELWGAVVDVNPEINGGIVVQVDGEQQLRTMTWEQVAAALGMPFEPKTDNDIVNERLSTERAVEQYNSRIPQGAELLVPVEGSNPAKYQFRNAEIVDGDVIIIKAIDSESGDGEVVDLAPEMISNLDALVNSDRPVPDVSGNPVPTAETTVQPVEIFDDPVANSLGITKDFATKTKRGRIVVNGGKLWAENPKLWTEWNDKNPSRVVSSKDFLEAKLEEIDVAVKKARTNFEAEAKGKQDPDRMEELQEKLSDRLERQGVIKGLYERYIAAENAQKEAEDAAKRAEFEAAVVAKKEREAKKQADLQQNISDDAQFQQIQKGFAEAKKDRGAEDTLIFGGQEFTGHYYIVEAETPTASHKATEGWLPTPGFPKDETGRSLNTRDYEHEQESQLHVMQTASDYDSRAIQHMVVVTSDGIVISGNERTMASQIAAQQNSDGKYIDYLKKHPSKYGFTAEQVEGFQHPRVIFVPDAPVPYTAKLFDLFNKSEEKRQNTVATAAKVAKITDDALVMRIADLFYDVDDINAVYQNPQAANSLLGILESAGVMSREDRPMYVDQEGKLTGAGEDFIESVLFGSIFSSSDQAVRDAMQDKSIRRAVAFAFPTLARIRNLSGEFSIIREMTDAVSLLARAKAANKGKAEGAIADYMNQFNLFSDGLPVERATVQLLAEVLNDKKYGTLRSVLNQYIGRAEAANSGQMNMFTGEVEAKEQILRDVLAANNINIDTYDNTQSGVPENAQVLDATPKQGSGGPSAEPAGAGSAATEQGEGDSAQVVAPLTQVQEFALSYTGIEPKRAVLESAQRKLNDIQDRVGEATTRMENVELMREKASILQEMLARLGAENTLVTTREDVLGQYKRDGASKRNLTRLENALSDSEATGKRLRGFNDLGKVYVIADDIVSSVDGKLAWKHEAKHQENRTSGAISQGIATGVSREEVRDAVHKLSGTDFYDNDNIQILVDEVLAHTEEYADEYGTESIPQKLEEIGIHNGDFINFVKNNIENGRRANGEHRGVMRNAAPEYGGPQISGRPGGTTQTERAGTLEGGRIRTPERSGEATKTGEGEVVQQGSAAEHEDTGALFSIQGLPGYTEQDVANLVRDHINEQLGAEEGEFSIADIRVIGSRAQWKAREESDLDVLVQYDGSMREDDAFNALHDEPLEIEGIEVDLNPINTEKSGTANEWIQRHQTVDAQGNAINADGSLIADSIASIGELTDEDFTSPSRSVILPKIPDKVDAAIGAGGKPVVIKKNIFKRNAQIHKDLTPEQSRDILNNALYNTQLYGQSQPVSRPFNWVVINITGEEGKNKLVLLEIDENKDNVEIVHWHYIDKRGLDKVKRQAKREGGHILMLPPDGTEEAGALSGRTSGLSSEDKGSESSSIPQVSDIKNDAEYLDAVEAGDMAKAQELVNKAAAAAGYSGETDYQGTLAFNGAAPAANGYFETREERKEAFDNGEFEDTYSLGDFIEVGLDNNDLQWQLDNPIAASARDKATLESIKNISKVVNGKKGTIKMYRAVPADITEESFRNGDWITPSRLYAEHHIELQDWQGGRIIEQEVNVDDIWWNGDDINEWGFDDGKGYAYKNTKNNRKLLDPVTYDDNGNVIPLSERFNPEKTDTRFSVAGQSNVVTDLGNDEQEGTVLFSVTGKKGEKSLVGIHNISEWKLAAAVKTGGLANPSMAVIDLSFQKHEDFGEISLIAPSSLIDSETGRNAGTYTGDAWTPTYPGVSKQMSDKGWDKFHDETRVLPEPFGHKVRNDWREYLDDDRLGSSLRWWFLQDPGRNPETIYNTNDLADEDKAFIRSLDGKRIFGTDEDAAKAIELFRRLGDPEQVERATKKFSIGEGKSGRYRDWAIARNEDIDSWGIWTTPVVNFIENLQRQVRYEGTIAEQATYQASENYVRENNLEEEFQKWLQDKEAQFGTKSVLFAGWTPDGDRKYVPNTVENASRLMNKEPEQNSYGNGGVNATRSLLLERMETLSEIRKNRGQLGAFEGYAFDTEEYKEATDNWFNVISMLADMQRISDNQFSNIDYAEARLQEAIQQRDPIAYLNREYRYNLAKDGEFAKALKASLKEIKALPAKYFETKFNRPVYLNEFAAAVIPSDTRTDVRKELEKAGLPIFEYDSSVEGSRKETVLKASEADGIRFSLIGEKGARSLDEALGPIARRMEKVQVPSKDAIKRFFGKKETIEVERAVSRIDNLETAKAMEADGKTAEAIKLATGWEKGKDGKWRYEESDLSINEEFFNKHSNKDGKELKEARWPITEAFNHDDAFKTLLTAYPELAKIQVSLYNDSFFDLFDTTRGYYDPTRKLLMLNPKRPGIIFKEKTKLEDLNSVVAHEVQHIIQEIEGFAGGGNTNVVDNYGQVGALEKQRDDLQKKMEDIYDADAELKELESERDRLLQPTGAYKEYWDKLNAIRDPREWNKLFFQGPPEYEFVGSEEERAAISQKIYDRRQELLNTNEEMKQLEQQKKELFDKIQEERYRLYRSIAGEVEARNVQARLGMSEEERRQTLAEVTEDIPREDQIILHDRRRMSRDEVRFSVTPAVRQEMDKIKAAAQADGTFMKAPNGKATSLSEEQWLLVRTPNFLRYFGDWINDPKKASKILDENGEPAVVFHGSSWNPLEEPAGQAVFDDSFRGTGSGDNGFFGRGFYFTYGPDMKNARRAEAGYYGRNITEAFLNIRNPFMFIETLYQFNGKTNVGSEKESVVILNMVKNFPELVKDYRIDVVDSEGNVSGEITLEEYAKIFEDTYDNKEFIIRKGRDETDSNVVELCADPVHHEEVTNGHKVEWDDYGFRMPMYKPGKNEDAQLAYTHYYLTYLNDFWREDHTGIAYNFPSHMFSELFEGEEFTQALKDKGYDGVVQSAYGDEAVAFEAEQIKSATAGNGEFTESKDIRFSIADFSPIRYDQTQTKAFKDWFKGSKVVNEDGSPMVVYRGASFDPLAQEPGKGVIKPQRYFTPDEKYAEIYARSGGANRAYFLNIKNPLDVRKKKDLELIRSLLPREPLIGGTGALDWTELSAFDLDEFIEQHPEYDGIVLDEGGHPDGKGGVYSRGISYMPFFGGNQVKSATDNNGEFSESPDVRFSVRQYRNFTTAQQTQKLPGTEYPTDQQMVRFSLSNRNRTTISAWLRKRKDLSDDQRKIVVDYLDELSNPKLQLASARWFARGVIRLPEDLPKVEQAVAVADRAKVDPLQYGSPMELIEAHTDIEIKEKPIDPNTVSTLHKAGEYKAHGVVIYNVDDSEESRQNMRKIINTHFGKESSPWCLLQGDGNGKLTDESARYWRHYSGYPKQAAFKDGKLLAFSANDDEHVLWWDRRDYSHYGVPAGLLPINGDALGRSVHYIYTEGGMLRPEEDSMLIKGNQQNGEYTEWWPNGNMSEHGFFKNGKKDGIYEEYNEKWGYVSSRISYKEGEREGLAEYFYDNGDIRNRSIWEDGVCRKVEQFYHGGKPEWVRNRNKNGEYEGYQASYNSDGSLAESYEMKAGKMDGEHKVFRSDGKLRLEENYKKGELDGARTVWDVDGNIKEKENYAGGHRVGINEYFDFSGRLSLRMDYDRHGVNRRSEGFHSDGSIAMYKFYDEKGENDGVWKHWDSKGNLTYMVQYAHGDFVRDLLAEGVTEEEADAIRFSVVTDKAELERLEKEPTVTLYRAMELIDGELYPPMSQKIPNAKEDRGKKMKRREGVKPGMWQKSDEDPGKAYQKEPGGPWYYDLKKIDKDQSDTNGVLYNPYLHLSASPLNDQFSAAYNRPNLVTVACEVPISEFTSGYKAEKAADSVGPKDWHSGTVTAQLGEGRQVVLSRWAKISRIVPDSEVASIMAPKLVAKNITVPTNVVTPSLRAALEARGVKFAEPQSVSEVRFAIAGMQQGTFVDADGKATRFAHEGGFPEQEGRTSLVERTYSKRGDFSFTGRDKIGNVYDVAYIFKELENAAVENSFIVFVKDGLPTILHTGIGSIDHTTIDNAAVIAGYSDYHPEEVYMVHNHPSGNVQYSKADLNQLGVIQKQLGKDVEVTGVIIDTLSGEFGIFYPTGELYQRTRDEEVNGEVPIEVMAFDKMVFSPEYRRDIKTRIRSKEDVASYISAHRLGNGPKIGALLLNNNANVTGNLVLPTNELTQANAEDVARQIVDAAVHTGANRAALFGDFALDTQTITALRVHMDNASARQVSLLDVVRVEGNYTRSLQDGTLQLNDSASESDGKTESPNRRDLTQLNPAERFVDAKVQKAIENLNNLSVAETSMVAGDILNRYDNQDGSEKYPWMSEGEILDAIENRIPYGKDTESLYALVDKYRRLDNEDFDEGRRDFSGGEKEELFDDILGHLRGLSDNTDVRFSVRAADEVRSNGIGALVGVENVSDFYMDLYRALPAEMRKEVADRAINNGLNVLSAMQDYLAEAARKDEDAKGLIRMAKTLLGDYAEGDLDEPTARYALWRGGRGVNDDDLLDVAHDQFVRNHVGVGQQQEQGVRFSIGDEVKAADAATEAAVDEANEELKQGRKEIKDLLTMAKAMGLQKEYDKKTIEAVTNLAKQLLKDQYIDALSRREVSRLLGIVRTSVGRSAKMVKKNADAIVEIVIENLLRREREGLKKLTSGTGSKTNATGVEVMGTLDVQGQKILKAYKAGLKLEIGNVDDSDDANTLYGMRARLQSRLESKDDAVRKEAEAEDRGLALAIEYKENIKSLEDEDASLKEDLKDAAVAVKDGDMSKTDYEQFVRATEDAIRENHIGQVEAYREFRRKMQEEFSGSADAKKSFVEREKERVENIHHLANSDMQGRSASKEKRPGSLDKLANSPIVRFFAAPLATFDQMLRLFGEKSVNGEGYLYNKFMRGWLEASERAYIGQRDAKVELDKKASEVFEREMIWSDLYDIERKMPTVTVKWWDDGKMTEHELTQGQLLYICMVNKMADGRMKLRKMGVNEETVEAIKAQMDERFLTLADWLQDEYLVNLRNKYNAIHERLFGAPMAAIENYFPLKINKRDLNRNEDIAAPDIESLPSTTTGSIIKRRRNSKALDLLNADAFSVVIEHVDQMEQWAAFAEFNKDVNALLSYKRFRNQVQNMASVYGSGTTLWNNFKDVCRIAGNAYHPQVGRNQLDTAAVNLAKGVTAAKISFRVYTALKQFLSMPAFVADANIGTLAKNLATPWNSWNWAMENLPVFEKRWKSRIAGDTRLMSTEDDWRVFRSRMYEKLSRWGMTPNAFVDAVTVAIGARSMYETRYARYIKEGFSEEQADKKAKQDATILYNETQQSNENAFLSAAQLDRTVFATAITVFRNSAMGFQRQAHDAIRNIGKHIKKGYKEQSIEFMTKQLVREGLSEEQAAAAAGRRYNRSFWRDSVRLATFAFLVEFAWNLGGSIVYLLFGKDDDEKEKMLAEAFKHALIGGSIEGLAGGNVMSEAMNMVAKGENLRNYDPTLLPILSDMKRVYAMMGYDWVAGTNELVNLAVQAGFGVNPQTLTDTVVAVIDACNGDMETSREAMLLIMRVLQVPQSQIDQIYIDELGVNASTARRMSPKQMAKRYADYKLNRNAPLTRGLYPEKLEEKRRKSYEKSFNKKVKERKEKK